MEDEASKWVKMELLLEGIYNKIQPDDFAYRYS